MAHWKVCSCVLLVFFVGKGIQAQDNKSNTDSHASLSGTVERIFTSATSFRSSLSFMGDGESFENIHYNRVDGIFLGIGSERRLSLHTDSTLLVHLGGGYAFGSHYWQVVGGLGKRFGERDWATLLGVEGHHYTDTHDAWKIVSWENSVRALVAGEDGRRYFRRTGWSIYAEQYIARTLWCSVRLGQDMYSSLPTAVTWSLFGNDDAFSANEAVREGVANRALFALSFSSVPKLRRARGEVEARVQVEVSRRDYLYERYIADVVWRQSIASFAAFHTRMRLGSVRGASSALTDFALGGIGSMPGYIWNESIGNRMGLWNVELLVRGGAVASGRLASSISLIFFADVGYTSIAQSNASPIKKLFPTDNQQWMTDVGVALGSRNGAIRIGAAWRTDKNTVPVLVVRLAPAW